MDLEEVNRFLIGKVTAIGVRHDRGGGHRLVCRRLRDGALDRRRPYPLLRAGRGLLLDQSSQLSVTGLADLLDHLPTWFGAAVA